MTIAAPATTTPEWKALHTLAEALRRAAPAALAEQQMGFVFCTQDYGLRNVCLAHPTLVLVLEGAKRYAAEGAPPVLATAPQVLLMPADTPMRVDNIPDAGTARYLAWFIALTPALVEATTPFWPTPPTPVHEAALGTGTASGVAVVPPDASLLSALHMLLRTALEHSRGGPSCPRLLQLQGEHLALMLALRGYGPLLHTRRDALVGQALRVIQQQSHLPWTLESLAKELGCGSRTLRRRLQEEGRTLRELLRHARLHSALGMLQQQRCTVSEAAFACGYDSPSRFSRRFHEHFGLLPSELLHRSRPRKAATGAQLA